MNYLDIFLVALIISLFLTPCVKWFAIKIGAVDKPNSRKVHLKPIPRIGGIAIYLGFMAAILFVSRFDRTILGVIIGGSILFIVGLIDDLKKDGLYAPIKFIAQIIAAFIVVHYFDIKITMFSNPFGNNLFPIGFISEPLSILWIVGITNTMNLIDGLDGLAAGVGSIAAFTLFLTAMFLGRVDSAILLIILFGATLGFLYYNFSPATIFMGDSGSTFIGYILATASIIGVLKSSASLALTVPVIILGIPIFDTLTSILRRMKRKQNIFKPDGEHLHHKLLLSGFSHRQAVLLIYYVSALLSLTGFVIAFVQGVWLSLYFVLIFFLIAFGAVIIKKMLK